MYTCVTQPARTTNGCNVLIIIIVIIILTICAKFRFCCCHCHCHHRYLCLCRHRRSHSIIAVYWMQRAKEANSMVCRSEFEIEICVRRRWRCVQLFTPSFYAHFLLARTQTLRHRYTLIKSHEQLQTGCQRKALWPFNDFLSPADWLKCVRFPLAPPSVAPFLFLYAFFLLATF